MNQESCSHCVLPASYPGISFDSSGVCNFCRDFEEKQIDFVKVREEVEGTLGDLCTGQSPHFDIALAFSGGKDSSYVLKYLKDTFRKAKIVAVTIDNNFMSDTARKNCVAVTQSLGVDHLMYRPNPRAMSEIYNVSLDRELYPSASLRRASSVCTSCIQVINSTLLNLANSMQIPVLAGGYLSGQIPSETGFMKQNLRLTSELRRGTMERLGKHLSPEALRLFEQHSGVMRDVLVFNPMAYLNVSEEEIVEAITPLGWARPADTGKSSSNCLLNDYAISDHLKKHGFHPYVAETASMVRKRIISRDEGLEKLRERFSEGQFQEIETRLGR